MNLTVDFREQLDGVSTWIAEQFDRTLAQIAGYWGIEHRPNGEHGNVHALSLAVADDVDVAGHGEFGGDVTAQLNTPEAVQIGALAGDPDGNIGPAQRFGSATSGWLVRVLPAGGLSPFSGSKGEYAIYDYAKSTVQPILRLGCIGTDPTLLGGGTLYIGDLSKEITGLYAKDAYLSNGVHEHNRTPAMGDWSPYTPVWSSTGVAPTLGNGSIDGRYSRVGTTVYFHINLNIGSTATLGSGAYLFSIPVACLGVGPLAHVQLLDASAGQVWTATGQPFSSTQYSAYEITSKSPISPTNPFAFAAGDAITLHGFYEAAS